jgi:hypothetical protein
LHKRIILFHQQPTWQERTGRNRQQKAETGALRGKARINTGIGDASTQQRANDAAPPRCAGPPAEPLRRQKTSAQRATENGTGVEKQKTQQMNAGLFVVFWLPDLDSNQGPAD